MGSFKENSKLTDNKVRFATYCMELFLFPPHSGRKYSTKRRCCWCALEPRTSIQIATQTQLLSCGCICFLYGEESDQARFASSRILANLFSAWPPIFTWVVVLACFTEIPCMATQARYRFTGPSGINVFFSLLDSCLILGYKLEAGRCQQRERGCAWRWFATSECAEHRLSFSPACGHSPLSIITSRLFLSSSREPAWPS